VPRLCSWINASCKISGKSFSRIILVYTQYCDSLSVSPSNIFLQFFEPRAKIILVQPS
jgi:hypothetical protein